MKQRRSSCKCGKVQFVASHEPILTGVCYCDDCQAGSRMLEELPGAPRVLDEDGGSSYATYRDDHWKCIQGEYLLIKCKLHNKSKTTRFVASCCNSAMFLKFRPGHWVSTYRIRFQDNLPPVEMRTQTKYRTSPLPFPDNAPTYRKFPASLFWRLIKARIAMALGK